RAYRAPPEEVSSRGGAPRPGLIPSWGLLPATVPAVLDAVVTALDQFGTKSLSEVMAPAIELADGFPIDEIRVSYIERTRKIFEKWPTSARLFLPGGRVPRPGESFLQQDLARTLRAIAAAEKSAAQRGRHTALMAARDYFYKGVIAHKISLFEESNGGLLRAGDFAAFRARVEEPQKTSYRGYEIYKTGFWAQGPAMLEMLNVLEGYDLKSMKHNSADYIHTLVETMKLAFADRDKYYGEPRSVKVPEAGLLSKDYAAIRRPLIDALHASMEQRPGDPVNKKPLFNGVTPPALTGKSTVPEAERANDTTCVNAVDKDGVMFSATPSGAW